MTSGPGIRAQVAKFLARELDADQFEDWIVQNTWNIHQDPDESLQRLAYAIDAALAEYSSGHIDEPELRRKLIPFGLEGSSSDKTATSSADPPPRAA